MNSGRYLRVWSALLALGGSASVGCAHSDAAAPAAGAETADASATPGSAGDDDEAAASVKEFHRHHSRGGIAHFVALSLDTLGADTEKKAQIEKIQSDLNDRMAPVRDAEKNVTMILADGVAAGNVDTAKVDAAIADLHAAAQASQGASADALNQLHAVLSPQERTALVDKVQAHWEVWKEVNHTAEPGGKEAGGRLAHLTKELSLTPDQVERISTALHASTPDAKGHFDPQQAEAHVQAFTTAFAADTFDAHTLPKAGEGASFASHGAMRMEHFVAAVTPILTADQRTTFAAQLRERANYSPTASN